MVEAIEGKKFSDIVSEQVQGLVGLGMPGVIADPQGNVISSPDVSGAIGSGVSAPPGKGTDSRIEVDVTIRDEAMQEIIARVNRSIQISGDAFVSNF